MLSIPLLLSPRSLFHPRQRQRRPPAKPPSLTHARTLALASTHRKSKQAERREEEGDWASRADGINAKSCGPLGRGGIELGIRIRLRAMP